jgi:hypothetical protein
MEAVTDPWIRLGNAVRFARGCLQDGRAEPAEIWIARAEDDLRECEVLLRDLKLQVAQLPKQVKRDD